MLDGVLWKEMMREIKDSSLTDGIKNISNRAFPRLENKESFVFNGCGVLVGGYICSMVLSFGG